MQSMIHKCTRLEKERNAFEELMVLKDVAAQPPDSPSYKTSHEELAAMASFDRLQSFFNLTALAIILEFNAQERFLDASSRYTIELWFQEAVSTEIPYHKWHAWLTTRISSHSPQ